MRLQLRTYTIKPGYMDDWLAVFQAHIRPIRESLGFQIPAAWTEPAANRFVWLMAYEGADWDTQDAAYHASPARKAITPDPAAMIEHLETRFVEPVG